MSIHQRYSELVASIDRMAEVLATVDTGDVWKTFACGEIEAICEVLEGAGQDNVANFLRGEHAVSDEEGDDHYGWVEP